jgi:hypothetical protein
MRLEPGDLLPTPDYRRVRTACRRAAIVHRRARCLDFGPAMRLQFEDAITVRDLVQEVLHIENADGEAAVREAIDQFAHLLPDAAHWSASLLIELPEAAERARLLPALNEAVHALHLEVPGAGHVPVSANADLPDGHRGRPSGVHFLRVALPAPARQRLLAGAPAVLACGHAAYPWRCALPPDTLAQLRADLNPPTREGIR